MSQPFRLTSYSLCLLLATAVSASVADDTAPAGTEELFRRLDTDGNGSVQRREVPADNRALFDRLLRKADGDGNGALSREEFSIALVPSRPVKHLEILQPDSYPGANALRYVLLTMDTSRNGSIEQDEVPEQMEALFEIMAERADVNRNGTLDRFELSRTTRQLIQLSVRYVAQKRLDVEKELARIEKQQGQLAKRFDETPAPFLESFSDPTKARSLFKQLDANADGFLEIKELPEQIQPQLIRLFRLADRDRDGGLSRQEFQLASERASRLAKPQSKTASMEADPMSERKANRATKKDKD